MAWYMKRVVQNKTDCYSLKELQNFYQLWFILTTICQVMDILTKLQNHAKKHFYNQFNNRFMIVHDVSDNPKPQPSCRFDCHCVMLFSSDETTCHW